MGSGGGGGVGLGLGFGFMHFFTRRWKPSAVHATGKAEACALAQPMHCAVGSVCQVGHTRLRTRSHPAPPGGGGAAGLAAAAVTATATNVAGLAAITTIVTWQAGSGVMGVARL